MDSYASSNQKPELKFSDNAFLISLPNLNNNKELIVGNTYEQKVLNYLKIHNSINRKDAETLLDVRQTMAGRVLKEMVNKEQLKKEGKAANTRYILL